jgi:hypothetical protein
MEIALDRRGCLVDQFDTTYDISRERLAGLSDDEWGWQPAAGMWSVRRADEAASSHPLGTGEWRLDNGEPDPEPVPDPLTTIAWRLGHLTSGLAGRWEWTFGGRSADPNGLVDFAGGADAALRQLDEWMMRWREGLLTLTDEQLDTVGFGRYPFGLDPGIPFIGIVWWTNREVIHHLAEVALMRDLYANLVAR